MILFNNNLCTVVTNLYTLIKVNSGDEGILKLLNISDDIAFRLSNTAQLEEQSLRCDIFFPNVTIGSSYWDGSLNPILSCDLTNESSYQTASEAFLRFPVNNEENKNDNSYILLPEDILVIEKIHIASGVLIPATNLIQQLLPGGNNNRSV